MEISPKTPGSRALSAVPQVVDAMERVSFSDINKTPTAPG
jgi:hypothetical protein